MDSKAQTGRLIVFEGPDGVGKSTLSSALAGMLTELSVPCDHLAFPGNEEHTLGRLVYDFHHAPMQFGVDEVIPASVQMLHVAAHLDMIERRIMPALSEGRWVILDRFWWSTWVYGKADLIAKDLLNAMIQVELIQWNEVSPSVVFVIERDEIDDDNETHHILKQGYCDLIDIERGKYPTKIINNNTSISIVLDNLISAIRRIGGVYV